MGRVFGTRFRAGIMVLGFVVFTLVNVQSLSAHEQSPATDSIQVRNFAIHFQVNVFEIDTAFSGNAAVMDEIRSIIAQASSEDSSIKIGTITVRGTASPEGKYYWNMDLARKRQQAMMDFLTKDCGLADSVLVRGEFGLAFDELADALQKSEVFYRDEALEIIADKPATGWDTRKKRLMDLFGGRAWHDMSRRFFKSIRTASAICIEIIPATDSLLPSEGTDALAGAEGEASTTQQECPVTEAAVTPTEQIDATDQTPEAQQSNQESPETEEVTTTEASTEEVQISEEAGSTEEAPTTDTPEAKDKKPFYMNLSTNMLYDVAAIPNIHTEFYLGKGFSLTAGYSGSWWKNDRKHIFWESYTIDLGLNWYFGKAAKEKPLQGHHIGAYAESITYDFEVGKRGVMACKPGGNMIDDRNWNFGVEYGYSLPVTKRLNIDFAIGAGYMGGKYYEYEPIDGHYVWKATKMRSFFGPTRARISLVWQIGRGNVNEGKR